MAVKKKTLRQGIQIPENITVSIDQGMVTVQGTKGAVQKNLSHSLITISMESNTVVFSSPRASKKERKLIGTFVAHLKNMFKGVEHGHIYKLKICSGHFPMNVKASPHEFTINNFLGEKVPRTMPISSNVTVKINGQEVIVESIQKELAGQTAASIERLTQVRNKDLRIFQDGIYLTEKDGKPIK